jgi:low temperature requirement protein LtrA
LEHNEQKDKERHATWLELFYDLIFVVTISQLAFYLHENISFLGFLQFLLLFVPVWWAWVGTTFFATRFYSEDVAHRLLLLIQMGGAAALAVNIHDALGKTSMGFALSYAFMRILLVVEYYRVLRRHSAESNKIKTNFPHPLIKRYIIGFSIASVIWIISAFVANFEIRLFLWLVGLIIDFATPLTAGKLHSRFAPDVSHLPERMGLFTLIVLGESIVSIVVGMTNQTWNLYSVTVSSLGLCISFSLWWLYFSDVKGTAIQAVREKAKIGIYYAWLYAHFPLVIGITAVGVGIKDIVSLEQGRVIEPATLWLICISLTTSLISLTILQISRLEENINRFVYSKRWILFRAITVTVLLYIPVLYYVFSSTLFISFILILILSLQIIFDYICRSLKKV